MNPEPEIEHRVRVRYFTPSEAQALLPALMEQVGEAQALVDRGRDLLTASAAGRDDPGIDARVRELEVQVGEILGSMARAGVQVKGLRPALLDFPALRYGIEVLLCWREGEKRLTWWHPISTGISGRKPVRETPPGAWEWVN